MKRIVSGALLALGIATAATLPYQGLATDAKGNPQADASYQVDFALYPSATSVTPLWSESQKLSTRKGLFSTLLGNETPIPDSLFKGTPLYLGVSFGGGSEGGRSLLGMTPWAKRALVSDTAKVSLGLSDSVTALRSALAGQASVISALSATVTAQGTQITAKDSVRASHMADSAKVAVGLKDSVIAVRSALRDTSALLRTKAKADSQALAKSVKDSTTLLRARLTDSTKALRDTVTSLRTTIAGLNTTVSGQASRISSLESFVWDSHGGIPWNTSINYGAVTDDRDGQTYRTVVIGSQTWMAQNLNYAGATNDTGVCYNNSGSYCVKYGRLYTWAQSLGLNDTCNVKSCAALVGTKRKGLCPTGWHVPSDAEWTILAEGASGQELKSTSGWNYSKGTDRYGFRLLPSGKQESNGSFSLDPSCYFWSATEDNATGAWGHWLDDVAFSLTNFMMNTVKARRFSARCLKD